MHDAPWLDGLDAEDLAFIRRFVLASGSLKQVAADYGVSYPTVRLRLDRLISKIEIWERFQNRSPLERALRTAFAEGKMDREVFRNVLTLYRLERSDNDRHMDDALLE
ncbi:MAG: DUF2089 family protein [Acidobacteria bacterium]|nr:DUF2089 family protein [Acidobacteriota bacterium]